MRPLGDRLLVRVPAAPDKIGLLWVPPSTQNTFTFCQAEVVERGSGVRDVRLQAGARVIVKRFGNMRVDDNAFAVREGDVLALIDVSVL